MANAIAKSWSCQACNKISGQPRARVGPHEFLVLRRPGTSAIYQCLVCHSNLMCEIGEPVPLWKALDAQPAPAKRAPSRSSGAPSPS
jgi:hypothetical protein